MLVNIKLKCELGAQSFFGKSWLQKETVSRIIKCIFIIKRFIFFEMAVEDMECIP